MLISVTDHAAERYRQRVRGTLEPKAEIVTRVSRAREAGRVSNSPRGTIEVSDLRRRNLIYVCRLERDELVVVTVYERGDDAAVPRRFTDALAREDRLQGRAGRHGT